MLAAVERNISAAWAEVAGMADSDVDARLAELTAQES
jgi:hypothetical protein